MKKEALLVIIGFVMLFISACESDISKSSDDNNDGLSEKPRECEGYSTWEGTYCCIDGNKNSICDETEWEQRFLPYLNKTVLDCVNEINDVKKVECFRKIPDSQKDVTLCGKIENSYTRQSCYTETFLANTNPKTCETVRLSDDYIYFCYSQTAGNARDINICNNIPIESEREDCLSTFAFITGNTSSCELLDGYLRERCFEQVDRRVKELKSFCQYLCKSECKSEDPVIEEDLRPYGCICSCNGEKIDITDKVIKYRRDDD